MSRLVSITLATLVLGAAPAGAATLAVSPQAGTNSTYTGKERLVLATAGTADVANSLLSAIVTPGSACAPTLQAQAAADDGSGSQQILYPSGTFSADPTLVTGPFQRGFANLDPVFAPARAGDYTVCAYLIAPHPDGSHDLAATPAATASSRLTVTADAQQRALAQFGPGDLLPASNTFADRVFKSGINALRANRAQKFTIRLRVPGKVIVTLRTRGSRPVTLAKGTTSTSITSAKGRVRTLSVRPTAEGRRYLRERSRVATTLTTSYDPKVSGRSTSIVTRPLTLRAR